MKNLIEITHLIREVKLKPSAFIVKNKQRKNKTDLFFEKILDGAFKTDREAAHFFYNVDSSHSKYKNLKRSLWKKLLNTIFFLEPQKSYSDYAKAYLYCCRYYFAAKILIFLQANKSGIELSKKVLGKALRFELTEFILGASRYLRIHYATRLADVKKFNYHNELFKTYQEAWYGESLAEEFYSMLVMPNVNKKANTQQTYQKAKEYLSQLKPYLDKFPSPYLHLLGNYLNVVAFMSINDYPNTIAACERAIRFFELKPYTYQTPIRVFLHHQLICYVQLREYEKGKEVARKSSAMVKSGTNNWYSNNELQLILALHSRHYPEAEIILDKAVQHPKFKRLISSIRERWLIYEAYINLLSFIGKISSQKAASRKYKLGKFLNSVPTYSKDKRGLNIPILIIQILYLIVKKDYDKTIDRFEAIEKYCSRYILKNENFRSNCFIKMLLQVPLSDFHKAGVERRAKRYFDQLQTVPLEIAKQAYEVEIIPYEDLWEILMQSLSAKFHQSSNS